MPLQLRDKSEKFLLFRLLKRHLNRGWGNFILHPSSFILLLISLSGCGTFFNLSEVLPTPETPTVTPPSKKTSRQTTTPSRLATLEQSIHQQINQYRQSRNLPPLKLDPRISEQARLHSQAMASGKVPFSHDGFEGRVQAIAKSINYRSAGENVAYNEGYSDPANQAVIGWLNSPGHYKNIVGDFDLTGIGAVKTPEGRYYFTQVFIRQAKYGLF